MDPCIFNQRTGTRLAEQNLNIRSWVLKLGLKAAWAVVFVVFFSAQVCLGASADSHNDDGSLTDATWDWESKDFKIRKLLCSHGKGHFVAENPPYFFRFIDETRSSNYVLLETLISKDMDSVGSYRKLVLESMESGDRVEVVIAKPNNANLLAVLYLPETRIEYFCEEYEIRDNNQPRPLTDFL